MDPERLYARYQELQSYVDWTPEDEKRMVAVGPTVHAHLPPLIDDFYEEIERHPDASKVIRGGQAQIDRLKGTLLRWIEELFSGNYQVDYVARRWRVGWRHVEIGLEQVYTNVALSRLRSGLVRTVQETWEGDLAEQRATIRSINKLLDLDLAIIEDAYQAEYALRLQRTERLATLGQVAGGVAHELRNPLNVVKTSVFYLLNARSATDEKRAEHLRRIERHVELADGVITALSSFAKMPVPNLMFTPILELFRDSLETSPPRPGIEVSVELADGVTHVLADRDQLRIVVSNLIRNACDAMPEGGSLTLAAREAGPDVELCVTDTGTGISAENLSRVMEPLFSTKARGLGLGLSIARSIIEKNNGSLRISSEPGRGSVFTITMKGSRPSGDSSP